LRFIEHDFPFNVMLKFEFFILTHKHKQG